MLEYSLDLRKGRVAGRHVKKEEERAARNLLTHVAKEVKEVLEELGLGRTALGC